MYKISLNFHLDETNNQFPFQFRFRLRIEQRTQKPASFSFWTTILDELKNTLKKSTKIGKNQKTLTSVFTYFLTAIAGLISWREAGY